MNKSTRNSINKLELTVIPVDGCRRVFKKEHEHVISHDFILKPDHITVVHDDTSKDVYKRVKDSVYWRCVGLRNCKFAILVRLHL